MKTFIFLRGVETPFKTMVANALMASLNPDVNTVRGIKLSLASLEPPEGFDKGTRKAADRTLKNYVKKILSGHTEEFIVIDNESLMPVHWQSYYEISNGISISAIAIGIEIISPENMVNDDQRRKLNLQEQNRALFKASMYKYHEIKSDADVMDVLIGIGARV